MRPKLFRSTVPVLNHNRLGHCDNMWEKQSMSAADRTKTFRQSTLFQSAFICLSSSSSTVPDI